MLRQRLRGKDSCCSTGTRRITSQSLASQVLVRRRSASHSENIYIDHARHLSGSIICYSERCHKMRERAPNMSGEADSVPRSTLNSPDPCTNYQEQIIINEAARRW